MHAASADGRVGLQPHVDGWLSRRSSRAADWPLSRLMAAKAGTSISVVVPARDEESTVGSIVRVIRRRLMREVPLVDELVVVDSCSTDGTARVAEAAGARVVSQGEVLDHLPPGCEMGGGKGAALWEGLAATSGDLVVFVDADVHGFTSDFITGLLGPLLTDPTVAYVKGFYHRPLVDGDRTVADGGGRVTELVARPLLNLYWPELAGFVQPLAGEYAGRRKVLEAVPFVTSYGVEVGLLIDLLELVGLDALAQVDLGQRQHRHQGNEGLGRMAAQIIITALGRLDRRRQMIIAGEPYPWLAQFRRGEAAVFGVEREVVVTHVAVPERPPLARVRARRIHPGEAGMTLRVLINAGPWLPVPPGGYGGIENVVATLVPELRRRGVYVALATVGASEIEVDEQLSVFDQPQFRQLQRPYNKVMGVASAHLQMVVGELWRRTDIDLVHDHVEALGPAVLAALGTTAPPVLHTLHWDLAKHPELYGGFEGHGRLFVNGVSAAQLARAPHALRAHSLGHVHLATPLATAGNRPQPDKSEHVVVLGRITHGKGQHVAARLARACGLRVVLAGPVGPHNTPAALARALGADPDTAQNPDVRYWLDEVAVHVDGDRVRWIGSLGPAARDELVATARATLFPLYWEEPGGTAVVESLALGTPVVGYRRGCLPELIEHGRTGLLADFGDEDALVAGLRAVDSIDPAECRRVAAKRFAPPVMAEHYLRLYHEVLASAGMRAWRPAAPAAAS